MQTSTIQEHGSKIVPEHIAWEIMLEGVFSLCSFEFQSHCDVLNVFSCYFTVNEKYILLHVCDFKMYTV